MQVNKGDVLFFKGKYGMYYQVTVLSVEGEHANVEGERWSFGRKKVRIDNLRKQPSKEYLEMSRQVKKEISIMDKMLREAKDNLRKS